MPILREAYESASREFVSEELQLCDDNASWLAVNVRTRILLVHEWAAAVSRLADEVVVSVLAYEGTWAYEVYSAGSRVIGMEFYPHEKPRLHGNPDHASQLLGVSSELFNAYYRAVMAACEDPDADEFPKAYADDEYEAADEYGFEDFARRLGVPGDPPFGQDDLEVLFGNPE